MIIRMEDKNITSEKEMDQKYDGQWYLFLRDPKTWNGTVLAVGTGGDDDFESLHELNIKEFDAQAALLAGYKNRDREAFFHAT